MSLVTLPVGMSILSSATPPNGANPGGAYSFEALPGGVVRLTMNTRLMHLDEARPLCGDIEDASATGAISLVVDVGRVGLATPAAAFHGMRTLRQVPIASIAFVHANPATRRVATLMLRAARFPRFGFFADEDAAVAWLHQEPEDRPRATSPAAPTASGRRRTAVAAAGAAILAGGIAAVRTRRRRRTGRALRQDPQRSRRRPRSRPR
ncbi:MAG TPA: hypothetical protein VII47_12510 [Actinomycetota bacterium]|jgi:hypothetical protein